MSEPACTQLLERAEIGRLACAKGPFPYILPISIAYSGGCLYCFAEPGQKTDWMRANPHVCIQVDEIVTKSAWQSVIAAGRFEELPDTPEWDAERGLAWSLVQRRPNWWQPGALTLPSATSHPPVGPIWYRICLDEITGREALENQD
jgi:nitroimidazol reductase NimA-like FMN-containing flavoprotein (pyridoxamine 5'-phosphate oxidase superfamily)